MFEASSLGGRRRKTSARRVVGTTCAPRGLDTSVLWVDSLSIFKTWSNFRKRGRKNPKRTKRETTAGSHTHTNPWKIPCASLNNKYIEKSLDDNDWLVGRGLQLQTEKNETSIKMSRISSIWEIENIPEGVSVVTATFLDRVWPCWNTRDAAEIFPAGHSRSVCERVTTGTRMNAFQRLRHQESSCPSHHTNSGFPKVSMVESLRSTRMSTSR